MNRLGLSALVCAAAAILLGSQAPAATLSPNWTKCVNEGQVYTSDQAIQACTALIDSGAETRHNTGIAYSNRCIAYKDKGEYDRAIVDCNKALSIDPRDDHAYNDRGAAYYLKDNYDQAITDYSQAIRLNPKFIDPWHNRGMAYAAKGDLDTAIADYNHALTIDPRDAVALYSRGLAKHRQGDQAGGDADIAAAKKINPRIGE